MKTYAEVIGERLKDKIIEIYLGDAAEERYYADNQVSAAGVVVGKVVDAEGDCLILNCLYSDKNKNQFLPGCVVYINVRNVRFLTELNGRGSVKELILNATKTTGITDKLW